METPITLAGHKEHFVTYLASLIELNNMLLNKIEPQAAFLLSDSFHGEAIIEAAQKLRAEIEDALADVRCTIG